MPYNLFQQRSATRESTNGSNPKSTAVSICQLLPHCQKPPPGDNENEHVALDQWQTIKFHDGGPEPPLAPAILLYSEEGIGKDSRNLMEKFELLPAGENLGTCRAFNTTLPHKLRHLKIRSGGLGHMEPL